MRANRNELSFRFLLKAADIAPKEDPCRESNGRDLEGDGGRDAGAGSKGGPFSAGLSISSKGEVV